MSRIGKMLMVAGAAAVVSIGLWGMYGGGGGVMWLGWCAGFATAAAGFLVNEFAAHSAG